MVKNNKNEDGMRYPSIDELLKKVDSKYKLAYISAKRANLIEQEGQCAVENPKCVKSVGQALEEVLEGKTTATFKH